MALIIGIFPIFFTPVLVSLPAILFFAIDKTLIAQKKQRGEDLGNIVAKRGAFLVNRINKWR
jgi:hypothetical protein